MIEKCLIEYTHPGVGLSTVRAAKIFLYGQSVYIIIYFICI